MKYKSRIPETKPLIKLALMITAVLSVGLICLCMAPADAGGTVLFTLGMAVTANQLITKAEEGRVGMPVAASTTLYQGTLAFINSSGYADDDIAAGANAFAGVVVEQADNSSGSNGDINVELWTRGVFTLTGSGFTQATVGVLIYASDNYTVTATATSNTLIGRCVEFISSTKIKVELLQPTA